MARPAGREPGPPRVEDHAGQPLEHCDAKEDRHIANADRDPDPRRVVDLANAAPHQHEPRRRQAHHEEEGDEPRNRQAGVGGQHEPDPAHGVECREGHHRQPASVEPAVGQPADHG